MPDVDAEQYFDLLLREHNSADRNHIEGMRSFIISAYVDGRNSSAKKRTSPWIIGWGGALMAVCVFIFVAVASSLFCTYGPVNDEVILKSCPKDWMTAVYMILKDWGSGIGIVGAGAGLAWSTFYKG